MPNNSGGAGGIGFGGALQVGFILLKLANVIDWSWWWVLAPTWMGIALIVVVVGVVTWILGR